MEPYSQIHSVGFIMAASFSQGRTGETIRYCFRLSKWTAPRLSGSDTQPDRIYTPADEALFENSLRQVIAMFERLKICECQTYPHSRVIRQATAARNPCNRLAATCQHYRNNPFRSLPICEATCYSISQTRTLMGVSGLNCNLSFARWGNCGPVSEILDRI